MLTARLGAAASLRSALSSGNRNIAAADVEARDEHEELEKCFARF
jgi:hypothetical protein